MPTKTAKKNASKAKRAGKSPSTQAGAYVKEEMHAMKKGSKHVKSKKQAIAVGLSEARRAGIKVGKKKAAPKKTKSGSAKTSTSQRGMAKRKDSTSLTQPLEHQTPLSSLESHMNHPEPTREMQASAPKGSERKKNLAKKKTYTGKEHSLSHIRSSSSQYRG